MKRDHPQLAEEKTKLFYGYVIVVLASLVLVVTDGIYMSFGVFFKPLSADLDWTRAMTSGAFSLSGILLGAFFIATGRLNDRAGPRVVVTICGLFLGLGYILMSQIKALWQLYLYYGVIVAIGASGGFTPMVSTVSRWFVKRKGLITGIVSAGVGLGQLIVPPIANWLISTSGWRYAYFMVGIASLVILTPIAQFLRRDPNQVGQLPYGEEEAKRQNLNPRISSFSFQRAISTKLFWILSVVNFCSGFCLFVVTVHIVPHATDLGISAAKATIILSIIGAAGIIGRVTIGSIGDRIGIKRAYAISFILLSVALTILMVAKDIRTFYLFAAVFSFGYAGTTTLLAPLVSDLFGLRSHGIITGSAIFIFNIGGATGSVIAGWIFDITTSYRLAFVICIILGIISLVAVSLLRPVRKESTDELQRNPTNR